MAWQKDQDARLRDEVWRTWLDNGLGVFVMRKPGFHKRYAVFSTRYGSIDNRFRRHDRPDVIEVPDGIAHFLEHQLFEDESGHVFNAFADLGASVNAYTSHVMTSYLFSATDNFPQAFDRLLDFVQAPHFTEAGVQKEIGIIEQEIRMYQDQPRHRLWMNLLQALYHVHPVRIDIAGTPESIRRITADTLQLCYDTFYHPSNMAVFVVGDVDPDAVLQQVADDMAGRNYRFRPPVERLFDPEPESVAEARVEEKMAAARPLYALGFKDAEAVRAGGGGGEAAGRRAALEALRREVTASLALSAALGRSSALYQELYDADLIDDGFGARHQAGSNFGHTVMAGETRDPHELHDRLTAGLERLRRDGIPEGEIRRAQRQGVGEFVQMFDSLEFIANGFLFYHFNGTSLFEYMQVLEQVTPDEVNARFTEHLRPEAAAVSIVWPKS